MEDESFKKMFIDMCKEALIKMMGLALVFGFYYLILLCWLKAITYLMTEFPDRKTDLNYLGILGIGYVVITFFIYMMKTLDRQVWKKD